MCFHIHFRKPNPTDTESILDGDTSRIGTFYSKKKYALLKYPVVASAPRQLPVCLEINWRLRERLIHAKALLLSRPLPWTLSTSLVKILRVVSTLYEVWRGRWVYSATSLRFSRGQCVSAWKDRVIRCAVANLAYSPKDTGLLVNFKLRRHSNWISRKNTDLGGNGIAGFYFSFIISESFGQTYSMWIKIFKIFSLFFLGLCLQLYV